MISSLRGTVIDKGPDYVDIECAGVGYHCLGTAETIAGLPRGEEAFVYTTLVVREDSHTLYAFARPEERSTFAVLQTVSGVGARVALAIMSVLTPEALYAAVSSGDSKALQKAPGVGKRLAERMAVDLKGKVPEVPTGSTGNEPEAGAAQLQLPNTDVQDQVAEALMGLGFPETKATRAVQAVLQQWPDNRATESSSLLRATLNYLGGQR